MKHYAASVMSYLREQIESLLKDGPSTRKLLFMMPAAPARVCHEIGRQLEDFCAQNPLKLEALIKVAEPLCEGWEASKEPDERAALAEIAARGWRAEHENLTAYRNKSGSSPARILVVLLIGVDRVTDASSLADFHQCDPETIWALGLKKSYHPWSRACLDAANIGYESETLAHFDEVLHPLRRQGLADLFQISALLEELDLSAAQDGRDAERVLLRALSALGLPSFHSYKFGGRSRFSDLVTDAFEFFSYHNYIDDRKQDKALKTIEKLIGLIEDKDPTLAEPEQRGPFGNDRDFVEAVRDYVKTGDRTVRRQLLSCDFVVIRDRILGYQRSTDNGKGKRKRISAKKLAGGPIEVVLSALWSTLADFRQAAVDQGLAAHEAIREIAIRGTLFKHDRDDGGTAEERTDAARAYLARLIGGVDDFVTNYIEPGRLACEEGQLKIVCELLNEELGIQPARTGEPSLEFEVVIKGDGLQAPATGRFAWRLPETQPYRLADELIEWAYSRNNGSGPGCLPVYQWPYHEELMWAKDDEEVHRVIQQCITDAKDEGYIDLLKCAPDELAEDPLFNRLVALASAHRAFLRRSLQAGLHAALAGKEWVALRKAYETACDAYLSDTVCSESPAASLLFRAFLAVQERPGMNAQTWVWEAWEPSAAITVLHPGVLEMLLAHVQYLAACFNTVAARELRTPGGKAFRETSWRLYLDLATIKTPLSGLLKNQDRLLSTDLRGEGLVHRIGEGTSSTASLTTRLMLKYESIEDEGISDAELFGQSRDSILLSRILRDYARMNPHAKDGLSIAVFQNHTIQPVIAAVHQYIEKSLGFLETEGGASIELERPYPLSVTFFTESSDDSAVARWIGQWRERWESADSQSSLARYQKIRLSVAHRIVSPKNQYEQFRKVIHDGLEVDVAVLWDFIKAGSEGNEFEPVEQFDVRKRPLKFPILERPFCALRDPGQTLRRARVLSNPQFSVSTRHAEVMARLSPLRAAQGQHHIVLGKGDYSPWQGVVDKLHERAGWVVCIDPNIDERLITAKNDQEPPAVAREIVGFGSGVGAHGEANYTISTEQFRLSDVLRKLEASIGEVYTEWTSKVCSEVARGALNEAQQLSGLSLVRATGRGEYVRDFLAYALTRKMLLSGGEMLCDHLVSLDAYQHWFDGAESDSRPDLLWLVARVDDDARMHVDLHLIECKLGLKSAVHTDKARVQLESGLRHLVEVFKPRAGNDATGTDRPDQRYWWLQLYRLIGSTAQIRRTDQKATLTALERLADGDYEVRWRSAAIAFWTDDPASDLVTADHWDYVADGSALTVSVHFGGSEFVRRLAMGEAEGGIPWADRSLSFSGSVEGISREADLALGDEDEGSTGPEVRGRREENVDSGFPSDEDESAVGDRGEIRALPSASVIPDRILLGTTANGSRPVYWEFGHKELSNRHLLIFGTSGMGKTYTIQALLLELGRLGQNSLIVDYTNGFTNSQLEDELRASLNPVQHVVQRQPLRINPFRRITQTIDDQDFLESESSTAQRVAGVFSEVYNFGDQQKSALYQAVKGGVESAGDRGMVLHDLVPTLKEIAEEGGAASSVVTSVISRILPFVDQNPFGEEDETSWEQLFTDSEARCHVLQLANFARDVARLITEFSLVDLYRFYRSSGSPKRPRVVVLDEIQNLDHREEGPLGQLLTEGRKFGFSLILATQIMSNLNKDERDRLFNASHKLFFRPTDTEMRTYADIAAMLSGDKSDVWQKRLSGLQKGECYSLGPSLNPATQKLEQKAFRVRITALGERF